MNSILPLSRCTRILPLPYPQVSFFRCGLHVLDDRRIDSALEALIAMTILLLGAGRVRQRVARRAVFALSERFLDSLVLCWEEDDLGVGSFSHLLHGLEVANLHGWSAAENVGGLSHQFGRLDFGASSDDLGFTGPLALRGHRQRVLQFLAEDDVLDQHALNLDAPATCNVFDNVADVLCNLLATLNNVLQDARTDDMTESGLGTLDERLSDVADAKGCLVWGGDVVVDDRGEPEGNVVLGHADLLRNLDELHLDINLDESFREWVDFDKTRVHCTRKATEPGYQANVALADGLVRVWTDDAAWDGTASTDDVAQSIHHASIPTVRAGIFGIVCNDLRVRRLEVFFLRRLNCDDVSDGFALYRRCFQHTLDERRSAIYTAAAGALWCLASIHC